MNHLDRERIRAARDQAKRQAIQAAKTPKLEEPWDDEPVPTQLDELTILRRLANGERGKDLALEYGVNQGRISEIKLGRRR